MGYMGFGMRKEVYKRKPKESFKKLKKIYGNDTPKVDHNPNHGQLTTDDVLNKYRYRSIIDTRAFQVIKVIIIFFLLALFINSTVVQPWLQKRKLAKYKEELVAKFNEDHDYILNSGNKLSSLVYFSFDSIDYSFLAVTNGIEFQGAFNHRGSEVAKIGTWDSNALSASIHNNELTVKRKDSIQTLKTRWMLIFRSDTTDLQYKMMLDQLKIKQSYISELRNKLRKVKIDKVTHKDSKTFIDVASTREFGTYEYIRTSKPYKETETFIKIDELTYLRRKK